MRIRQKTSFKKLYKKLHPNQLIEVNNAITLVADNPYLGTEKSGDLAGIFVYKFRCINHQFLLAYEFDPETLTLILIGVHENFYTRLKR